MKRQFAAPNLFSLLAILVLGTTYFSPFVDLDFTWQVRIGERIIATGDLLPPDAFTYTIAGSELSQFEWLYELALYLAWSFSGYGGLKLLRTLLVAAPLLLLGLQLRRDGLRWPGIVLALVAAVFALSPAWNLRPMHCSTIALLLVTGWLHEHCAGRRPLSLWLPVVMALWGNLHPGVIVGQGLLAGAIGWEWLNRWLKVNAPLDRAACVRLSWVGGLGLAATLLSPAPVQRLLLPFEPRLQHPIMRIFAEMQPLYELFTQMPVLAAFVYVVAALVGLTVVLRFRQYRLWEVATLAGLAVLANSALRCMQDWMLIMLALGVPHLAALGEKVKAHGSKPAALALRRAHVSCRRVLNSPLMRFQPFWPAAAVALLAVLSLIPPVGRRMPKQEADDWPVGALDYAEANGLHGRFFAYPDFGSYLTWRLRDRALCYVDTRGFLFPPELLIDTQFISLMAFDWRQRLERVLALGTDYFLLETVGPRGRFWRALQPHVGTPLHLGDSAVLLSAAQVRQALARLDDQPLPQEKP